MARGLHSSATALISLAIITLFATGPILADITAIRGLIRSGQFAEAVAQCDLELKAQPKSFALHTMKGLALQAAADRVRALSAFRQALVMNPSYEPALQAAAQIEFDTRDPGAIKTLESVLRVNPSSETAHVMLAELLFEKRSCELSLNHFEKAPGSLQLPSVKWQIGVCLLTLEQWASAASHFESLLTLREHGPTRYNLGLAHWNAKDYPAAVAALAPADVAGASPDTMRLYANSLESAGDTPKAFEVLQRAIRQNPNDESLLIDLAVMCMDHKALDLGLEVLAGGIQHLPDSAKLQTLRGSLLVRRGDVEKAQQAFHRAQELSPESGLGNIGLASTFMEMGLAAEAAKVLREQLAIGRDSKSELTLARALLLKGPTKEECAEAAVLLSRILKQEPGNTVAHGLLGKAYVLLGDKEAAAKSFANAIRLDPQDRTSTYQLMTLHRKAGRSKEADDLAQRVRTLLDRERAKEDAGNRFRVIRETGAFPEK